MQFGRVVANADAAFQTVLTDLLGTSSEITAGVSKSIGSLRKTREITNYLVHIKEPRRRIVFNPARRLDPVLSAARFVWLMSGSNKVADIATYDPKVVRFSDDGTTIPGSCFGYRMMHSAQTDQLAQTIKILKTDSNTRRAVISIYQPPDCGRDSSDIPCLLSLVFHIRDQTLHATQILRSNNSFSLFPHNFFELSMLAEVIAREVNIPLGCVSHFALSMHLYDSDYVKAKEATSSRLIIVDQSMPEMPSEPRPLTEISRLITLEEELREDRTERHSLSLKDVLDKASSLSVYWRQFYYVLAFNKFRVTSTESSTSILGLLEPVWREWLNIYFHE